MFHPLAIPAAALGAALALCGCAPTRPAPGLASQSYSNNHTTAAGGFELGPEDYNTNGGAFGPDQGSP